MLSLIADSFRQWWLGPISADADLTRLRGLAPGHSDVQEAVAKFRLDLRQRCVVAKTNHPTELAGAAFLDVGAGSLPTLG